MEPAGGASSVSAPRPADGSGRGDLVSDGCRSNSFWKLPVPVVPVPEVPLRVVEPVDSVPPDFISWPGA
ncbi:hypothetical protein ACU4GR_14255 [Methylobacterium oryzae CBMB20]